MGRYARRLVRRGILLVASASVLYYLWHGITGEEADRWYGSTMIFMIIAVNLVTPALLLTNATAPKAERLDRQKQLFQRMGQTDLAEALDGSREWTDANDPMTHPLYYSEVGTRMRVNRITDTRNAIRSHPVVRLRLRGEVGAEVEVVTVAPRIAVPRVGDIVRVLPREDDPTRYRYAGPVF
jgi:hypothetical protein